MELVATFPVAQVTLTEDAEVDLTLTRSDPAKLTRLAVLPMPQCILNFMLFRVRLVHQKPADTSAKSGLNPRTERCLSGRSR